MDESNTNAQNKNAQQLVQTWPDSSAKITALHYHTPAEAISGRSGVHLVKLWRRRLWQLHLALVYLGRYDGIFYPGVHPMDSLGLHARKVIGLRCPVIATVEGLVGDATWEEEYSKWAEHPVFCQHVGARALRRIDAILSGADHIIAISPFLGRMTARRYGNKVTVHPLGIDPAQFYPLNTKTKRVRPLIISAGRCDNHKRPEFFLNLAQKFPQADFIWYGNGGERERLSAVAAKSKVKNCVFRQGVQTRELADSFREADIFIMTSKSEGVPKVTQEAAACGLPIILFGFYEAPSVEHHRNGYVCWTDEQFSAALGELLQNDQLRREMADASLEMSRAWHWKDLSLQWGQTVSKIIQRKNLA